MYTCIFVFFSKGLVNKYIEEGGTVWTKEVKIADQNNMTPYKGLKFYDPPPFPGSKFHDPPLPKMSHKHHLYYVNFMHDRVTVFN